MFLENTVLLNVVMFSDVNSVSGSMIFDWLYKFNECNSFYHFPLLVTLFATLNCIFWSIRGCGQSLTLSSSVVLNVAFRQCHWSFLLTLTMLSVNYRPAVERHGLNENMGEALCGGILVRSFLVKGCNGPVSFKCRALLTMVHFLSMAEQGLTWWEMLLLMRHLLSLAEALLNHW